VTFTDDLLLLRTFVAPALADDTALEDVYEYSESNAEILTELDKMLTQLSGLLPSEPELPDGATVTGGFSVGQIVRCQPR
jgi:hypothetical protein